MGVASLFTLLEVVGARRNIEALSGLRVAVDASVWLGQILKAMRDERGEVVANAHLYGFFARICRLLFNRIRPVFVFDGSTPALKRQTTAARRRRREQHASSVQKMAQKLFANQLRQRELSSGQQSTPDPNNASQRTPPADSVDLRPEEPHDGGDDADEDDGLDLDQLASSGTELDPEVLQSLPPSTAMQLVDKMRDHNFGVTRQKLQELSDTPNSFSSQQIQSYLQGTKAKRTWNEALKRIGKPDEEDTYQEEQAAEGVPNAQRIQSNRNREFIFATSKDALLNQESAGAAPSERKQQEQETQGKKRKRNATTLDLLPSEPEKGLQLTSASLHPKLPKPLQSRVFEARGPIGDAEATPPSNHNGDNAEALNITITLPHSARCVHTSDGGEGEADDDDEEWEDVASAEPSLKEQRKVDESERPAHKKHVYSRSHGFLLGRSLAEWGEEHNSAEDATQPLHHQDKDAHMQQRDADVTNRDDDADAGNGADELVLHPSPCRKEGNHASELALKTEGMSCEPDEASWLEEGAVPEHGDADDRNEAAGPSRDDGGTAPVLTQRRDAREHPPSQGKDQEHPKGSGDAAGTPRSDTAEHCAARRPHAHAAEAIRSLHEQVAGEEEKSVNEPRPSLAKRAAERLNTAGAQLSQPTEDTIRQGGGVSTSGRKRSGMSHDLLPETTHPVTNRTHAGEASSAERSEKQHLSQEEDTDAVNHVQESKNESVEAAAPAGREQAGNRVQSVENASVSETSPSADEQNVPEEMSASATGDTEQPGRRDGQDVQREMSHLEEQRRRMEQQIRKQARYAEEPTEEMHAECQVQRAESNVL